MDSGEWMLEESSSRPEIYRWNAVDVCQHLEGHLFFSSHHLYLTLIILSSQVYHYIQIHQCGEHNNIANWPPNQFGFFSTFWSPFQLTNFPDFHDASELRNTQEPPAFPLPLNSSATFTASPGLQKELLKCRDSLLYRHRCMLSIIQNYICIYSTNWDVLLLHYKQRWSQHKRELLGSCKQFRKSGRVILKWSRILSIKLTHTLYWHLPGIVIWIWRTHSCLGSIPPIGQALHLPSSTSMEGNASPSAALSMKSLT